MDFEKQIAEIAEKYCNVVRVYPDPENPYEVWEMKADKNQAAAKRKIIIAYLETINSIHFEFNYAKTDPIKRKNVASEISGAKNSLFQFWHLLYPKTSAWETIYNDLDNAGIDLYGNEYKMLFPKGTW